MTTISLRDRYRGCLLGGAVGDALGLPIEFKSAAEIRLQYGKLGLTDYVPAYGRLGTISDDTQMSLFTADGLIRSVVRYKLLGLNNIPDCVNHAYLRWLLTQGVLPRCQGIQTDGWLFQIPQLHAARCAGSTCMSSLIDKIDLNDLYAKNNSKGNGGVMRVAPVGLMFGGKIRDGDIRAAFDVGCQTAKLTHGHSSGYWAAGAMAAIVMQLVAGVKLREALYSINDLFDESADTFGYGALEVSQPLLEAKLYASSNMEPREAIERLGKGWVAEEALAIAVFCCLHASTLEQALILSVNHGGDSDSTGAIAGNLAGAMYGIEAIPRRWLSGLEIKEIIQTMADDLLECGTWELSSNELTPESESILQRYPSW